MTIDAGAVRKAHCRQRATPDDTAATQPSWLKRIARVLLCLVFVNAVLGKVTGFGTVADVIGVKVLPLAPVPLVADQDGRA